MIRTKKLLFGAFGFLCLAAGLSCMNESDINQQQLAIVADKGAQYQHVLAAVQRLGRVTELPTVWSTIANDPTYPKRHRRLCVALLFSRHVQPGMSLPEMSQMMDGARWLEGDHITQIGAYIGPLPIDLTVGDKGFVIKVLPESSGEGLTVYLRASGRVSKADLLRMIRGEKGAPESAEQSKIREVVCVGPYFGIWRAEGKTTEE